MAGDAYILPRSDGRRYEAVLRLSEALSVCTEPEDLTKILSEQLHEFLDFLQFYIIVYKEKSSEVEWAVVGREKNLMAVYADVPVEQRPSWQAYTTQQPFHIHDWSSDARVPARLKQGIAAQGLDVGPLVFVPLTTPHRRLGALGMSGSPGTVYRNDDISFLRLVGRVVAFAIDDNFNLRRAEIAQRQLQRQNELLQRSERELREVIETIPSMAWSAAPDGSAEFFNGRWLAYAGLTADQAQGWGWTVAVHPDDLKVLVDYWQTIMVSGQPGEIEARLRRFDGVYRWFLFRATASLDDNGRIVKWYGTNTDIEERKSAEQALRRSEAYLAEAQRLTHTASWAYNPATEKALYWSDEMFRICGLDPQQGPPTSEAFLERVHPEDRESVAGTMRNAAREKTEYRVEHRIIHPNGTIKHTQAIGHPVLDHSGNVVEFVGSAVDITDVKHAEQERERLRQELANLAHLNRVSTMGELTASLAHEIKQPIGAAVTNADACVRLLDRDQPDLPGAREAALEMAKDARRAAEIIDRVRSLYHKGSSQLETIEVNEVISEMVVMLQNEANRHSVTIRRDLAEGLPNVMADRVQLQQVLLNLMLNGIEAIRDTSGELTIKSKVGDDSQLLISVTDTGVGLPTENAEQIFNPFFTTKSQGTGLGLAITRSIVESHGGRIWATGNSGRGATFSFTLPSRVAVAA
jgi:PAS domain S-box-containing protein